MSDSSKHSTTAAKPTDKVNEVKASAHHPKPDHVSAAKPAKEGSVEGAKKDAKKV